MILEYLFVIWLGLILGSFMTMLIYRIQNKKLLLGRGANRSYCPHCRTILKWYDLLPVISYFMLRGRCRYCGQKMGVQYIVIETICVLIMIFAYNIFSKI